MHTLPAFANVHPRVRIAIGGTFVFSAKSDGSGASTGAGSDAMRCDRGKVAALGRFARNVASRSSKHYDERRASVLSR